MLDFAQAVPKSSFIGALLRLPLKLIPSGVVVPILSGPLRGSRWCIRAGLHGCWLGTYELDKQNLFASLLNPGLTVYDIGANVGFYTLLASKYVGTQGQVYAFEPAPDNLLKLQRHVNINACRNARVLDCALSNQPGRANFDDNGSYTGKLSAHGKTTVKLETLDGLLAAGRISPAQLVKIDVEGAELAVLEGGRDFFQNHAPTILLATHGVDIHRQCCDRLRSWGYTLKPIDATRTLDETDEIMAVKEVETGNPIQPYAG